MVKLRNKWIFLNHNQLFKWRKFKLTIGMFLLPLIGCEEIKIGKSQSKADAYSFNETILTLQSNNLYENKTCQFSKDSVLSSKERPNEALEILSEVKMRKLFTSLGERETLKASFNDRSANFLSNWRYSMSTNEPAVLAINGEFSIENNSIIATPVTVKNYQSGEPIILGVYSIVSNKKGEYFIIDGNNCMASKLNNYKY